MQQKTNKAVFPLLGLHCAGCANRSEKIAAAQPGVKKAAANFAAGLLTVEYETGTFDAQKLKSAIENAGYQLIVDSEDPFTEQEKESRKLYKKLKRKVWITWILAVPLMVIGMAHDWHFPGKEYVMMWLAFFILLIGGRDFIRSAWYQAKQWSANMDTLVALSTLVSFVFSLASLAFEDWTHDVYFEASGMIIAFVLLGKLMESRAKNGTSKALQDLMHLQPSTAFLIENGQEQEVPISKLQPGDHVSVHPGAQMPVDGIVQSGSSYVDESMITGEPLAVLKQKGSKVVAGTINQKGSLAVEITGVGQSTVLASIVRMVREAQGSKAPAQRVADKVAAVFVPVILLLAVLTFILWLAIGGKAEFNHALVCALSVLVIACPCALGLATPTALMVGMGRAARNHILIKDASALEELCHVDAVVMDKTGTLTQGKPAVSAVCVPEAAVPGIQGCQPDSFGAGPVNPWQGKPLPFWLGLFKAAEQKSEHPLAAAVVAWVDGLLASDKLGQAKEPSASGNGSGSRDAACPDNSCALFDEIEDFETLTGKGLRFHYQGQDYWAGGMALVKEKTVVPDDAEREMLAQWQDKAYSIVAFGHGQHVLVYLGITDEVKPCSAQVVAALEKEGVAVYMLTGDHEKAAAALASQIGIKHYKAGLLPQDKEDFIKDLQQQGRKVAMVGDGINDSQALARADISMALKRGTDIAMNVASVVLIGNEKNDLEAIPKAIALSRRTLRIIKENLFWAFIYNVIGIVFASGLLFPFFGWMLNPMIASAAMAFSSVSVVSNSLRLKFVRIPRTA